MHTLHFDTLEVATKFKQAGFTDAQAEVLAQIHKQTINSAVEQVQHDYHLDDAPTKRDLKELELTLSARIKDTEIKIAETKADLIRWVVGVGLLQITIITALILKMTSHL